MLVALDTAYADTTAADLRFALGLGLQPALRDLAVPLPGGATLTLRLLGASHQVVLPAPGGDLVETVACLPADGTAALPEALTRPGYRFTAEVRRLTPAAFTAEVAALRAGAARAEHVLAGEFPGARDALTVLAAQPIDGGATWWTAHAYPQTGELVTTRTVVKT